MQRWQSLQTLSLLASRRSSSSRSSVPQAVAIRAARTADWWSVRVGDCRRRRVLIASPDGLMAVSVGCQRSRTCCFDCRPPRGWSFHWARVTSFTQSGCGFPSSLDTLSYPRATSFSGRNLLATFSACTWRYPELAADCSASSMKAAKCPVHSGGVSILQMFQFRFGLFKVLMTSALGSIPLSTSS